METSVVVITAELIVLGCAGLLSYLAFRAYRRTGSPSLRTLVIGLALVAGGSILGGVLHQVGSVSFDVSLGVDSAVTAVGFLVVIYAVFAGESGDGLTQ